VLETYEIDISLSADNDNFKAHEVWVDADRWQRTKFSLFLQDFYDKSAHFRTFKDKLQISGISVRMGGQLSDVTESLRLVHTQLSANSYTVSWNANNKQTAQLTILQSMVMDFS